MTDFDAIVVGAGHNGLTAAALMQQAGLRTLCLDAKLYPGGMASTVELFDGFRFEIAGSVQVPTSAVVQRGARVGRAAHGRPRGDVGAVARCRRRPRHLLHRPDEAADTPQRGARRRSRQRYGRPDGLVPGSDEGARPVRRGTAAENPGRDVCLCDKRIRTAGDQRHPVRLGQRRTRPVPPGPGEARRAARNAGLPGRQHHLPGSRHPGQRSRTGLRTGGARRERHADQEVPWRHGGGDRTPAANVHRRRRSATPAQQGRRDPGQRRACLRRPAGRR